MILIGSTNLTRTQATGDFYCPHCGAIRDYRLRARRPFMTFYFIPVVPIGPTEQYVQCTRCGTHSPTLALDDADGVTRRDGLPQVSEEVFEAAVMIVVADGVISEREISALLELGWRLGIPDCDRELLGSMCSSIRLNGICLPTTSMPRHGVGPLRKSSKPSRCFSWWPLQMNSASVRWSCWLG